VKSDEITLTLPRDRDFHRVAHLVLGGLAVRLDLTFEHLEDLQLALAGLLEHQDEDGEVTVAVRVTDDAIETSVGPCHERIRRELERDAGEDVGLRRVLDAVVDEVRLERRNGDDYVELRKRIERRNGGVS
jgi:anti-sigma regulatory factor (Ser/Thr protein kinase)